MSAIKPITVYVHGQGPNPFKVIIALEELGIPYEKITIEDPKVESFLKINPNGRLPAIKDPNANDFILWESGAILEYIVDNYDKEHKLGFANAPEKWLLKQYLHFQMSGQGPYFGQMVWFRKFHQEQLESAKNRYDEQTLRVFQVLDSVLKDKEYLVGDKFTYADLSFIPWNRVALLVAGDYFEKAGLEQSYPNFWAWQKRIFERPAVQKVYGQ